MRPDGAPDWRSYLTGGLSPSPAPLANPNGASSSGSVSLSAFSAPNNLRQKLNLESRDYGNLFDNKAASRDYTNLGYNNKAPLVDQNQAYLPAEEKIQISTKASANAGSDELWRTYLK